MFQLEHGCNKHVIKYDPKRFPFTLRKLTNFFRNKDEMSQFRELLDFKHFKSIVTDEITLGDNFNYTRKSIFKDNHPLNEMLYLHARKFELKIMARLVKYIELEEDFNNTY